MLDTKLDAEQKYKMDYDVTQLLHINWNRMAFLSRYPNKCVYGATEESSYRLSVQNHFSNTTEFDVDDFIMPLDHKKYILWKK